MRIEPGKRKEVIFIVEPEFVRKFLWVYHLLLKLLGNKSKFFYSQISNCFQSFNEMTSFHDSFLVNI